MDYLSLDFLWFLFFLLSCFPPDIVVILFADLVSLPQVECQPVRADGEIGNPMAVESPVPVQPGQPSVSNVKIDGVFTQGNPVTCSYTYWGGYEGETRFQWKRNKNGRDYAIPGANESVYTLTADDVDCTLSCDVTPLRSDGAIGDKVMGQVR